jgi:hypothetical protein
MRLPSDTVGCTHRLDHLRREHDTDAIKEDQDGQVTDGGSRRARRIGELGKDHQNHCSNILSAWIPDHDARSHQLIGHVFDDRPGGRYARRCARQHCAHWLPKRWSLHLVCIGKTSGLSLPAKAVAIPVAVSAFADEIYAAPRSRAERAYPKLTHYNKLDSRTLCSMGTAEIFSEEVRAGFRPLGK